MQIVLCSKFSFVGGFCGIRRYEVRCIFFSKKITPIQHIYNCFPRILQYNVDKLKKNVPDAAVGTVIETEWFKKLLSVEESTAPTEFVQYMLTLFNLECIEHEQLLEA